MNKIQKYTGYIINFLIIVLPFNALITSLIINVLSLPTFTLLWKEVVLSISALIMLYLNVKTNLKEARFTLILIPIYILSTISSLYGQISIRDFLLGFRFELFWFSVLAVGLDFVSIHKNKLNLNKIISKKAIIIPFIFIILICTLQLFSNGNVLGVFGFESGWGSTNDKYILQSPTCHGIGNSGNICRLTAGFASPNHFAGYLIFVLFFILGLEKKYKYLLGPICGLLILLTFSRFAIIALIFVFIMSLCFYLKDNINRIKQNKYFKSFFNVLIIISLIFPLIILAFNKPFADLYLEVFSQTGLSKNQSTADHIKLKSLSIDVIKSKPSLLFYGYGLSGTGTTAKSQYKNVLDSKFVKENMDLAKKYDLKPFNIPVSESWFLQIYLNGGLLYFILYFFVALIGLIGLMDSKTRLYSYAIFSIVVGNVFLHIWESQVVAIFYVIFSIIIYHKYLLYKIDK